MKKIAILSALLLFFGISHAKDVSITSSADWDTYLTSVNNTIPKTDVVNIQAGVSIELNAALVNNGTINVAGNVTLNDALTFTNNGTLNVAGGFTLDKTATIEHFGTINCAGTFTVSKDASIVNHNAKINSTTTIANVRPVADQGN